MPKTFQLHLNRPEHNLLNRHGRKALLTGMSIDDLFAVKDLVFDSALPNADFPIDAAILYLIGVMQGIHNERARRSHE